MADRNAIASRVKKLVRKGFDHESGKPRVPMKADAGFGDFLPRWSDADLRTIMTDGKIPVYERWKDKLSAGRVGLDSLLNISGLCSFATDQKAFDDRVRSLL
jgi:hypothetical protein